MKWLCRPDSVARYRNAGGVVWGWGVWRGGTACAASLRRDPVTGDVVRLVLGD